MKRFIEGEERSQVTLLPECLDDYIAEDNPVRVVDVFVDELQLHEAGLRWRGARRDRAPVVPPGGAAEDLHLRLPQPGAVEPTPGARSAAQRRADVADRAPGAGLQDHRRLPQGQRRCHPQGLPRVRAAVPAAEAVHRRHRRHRRQQVQGGQQPRQELHRPQAAGADAAARSRASSATWSSSIAPTAMRRLSCPSRVAHLKEKIAKVKEQMQALGEIGEQMQASRGADRSR